jgi:hypothetical protein
LGLAGGAAREVEEIDDEPARSGTRGPSGARERGERISWRRGEERLREWWEDRLAKTETARVFF